MRLITSPIQLLFALVLVVGEGLPGEVSGDNALLAVRPAASLESLSFRSCRCEFYMFSPTMFFSLSGDSKPNNYARATGGLTVGCLTHARSNPVFNAQL